MGLKNTGQSVTRIITSPVWLATVIFVLALIPRILNLDVFVGPDEPSWVTRSDNFACALATGDFAGTYQSGHPGVTLLWVELPVSWGRPPCEDRGLPQDSQPAAGQTEETDEDLGGPSATMAELAGKRQAAAIVHALVVALAALIVRAVFGPDVAWVAGFLLAFDPFLLTESRAVRSEGMVTSLSLLALLSLLLFLPLAKTHVCVPSGGDYRKKPRLLLAGLVGALTALALLSKVSAAALLPVAALVTVLAPVPTLSAQGGVSPRWRSAFLSLAVGAGAVVLTIVLLWPALWVAPGNVARQMADYVGLRAVEGGGGANYSFFMGRSMPGREFGPLFYPVVLLFRTGPWQWLGLLLLAIFAWRARDWARYTTLSVMVILGFLAAYLALITVSGLKFDRYTMPMIPALDVLAALGLVMTWRWVVPLAETHVCVPSGGDYRGTRPGLARFGWLAALIVLVSQLALALPHHPYYYTYYNPLLGGIRQAVQVVPVGTGYEGVEKAAAYLNSQAEPEKIRLATAVSSKIKSLFKGQTIAMSNQDGKWLLADYTFIYISQLQRGKHDPEIIAYLQRKPLAYSFQLAGLDYGWIYRAPGAQYYGGDTKLEGRATLRAFDLSATQIGAGQVLTATIYFRNEGQHERDRFYVRLADADGYVWADGTVRPRPGFEDAFRTRKAIVEGQATLSLPVGMLPGTYILKMGYADTATGQPIGEFALPVATDDVVVHLPAVFPSPGVVQPPNALNLDVRGELTLAGYQLDAPLAKTGDYRSQVQPGESAWLTLHWQAKADVHHDYVVALRLLDATGAEIMYWLGRPVHSALPTTEWKAGQVVQDPWLLKIPEQTQPGIYNLEIALFDADTRSEVARARLGALSVLPGDEK